ncbi:MAG: hypothetical protein KGZ46_06845 [Hydrogenophaga sp.]|nr:hypothetical protein [Hydrogenophaga sp.]
MTARTFEPEGEAIAISGSLSQLVLQAHGDLSSGSIPKSTSFCNAFATSGGVQAGAAIPTWAAESKGEAEHQGPNIKQDRI